VRDQGVFKLTTPAEYLEQHPINQVAQPSYSRWGDKGYAEVWLNETNDWVYPPLHVAAERLVELAQRFETNSNDTMRRALNQYPARAELGLGVHHAHRHHGGYAERKSLMRFAALPKDQQRQRYWWLAKCEYLDNIFPGRLPGVPLEGLSREAAPLWLALRATGTRRPIPDNPHKPLTWTPACRPRPGKRSRPRCNCP
jgi:predicted glycosyl hydrolase (DUF1957 family)